MAKVPLGSDVTVEAADKSGARFGLQIAGSGGRKVWLRVLM